jgi:hypothetical protein
MCDLMNETRKKLILNEILYWKKNRLLPERYCDYLLALYTEGEEINIDKKNVKKHFFPFALVASIIIISLALNYFTQLPIGLQIGILTSSVLLLLGTAKYFLVKRLQIDIPLIVAAFLLLLGTVQTAEHLVPDRNGILYFCLLCHCGLWIFVGKRFSMVYFFVAGVMGTAVVFYFLAKLYNIF